MPEHAWFKSFYVFSDPQVLIYNRRIQWNSVIKEELRSKCQRNSLLLAELIFKTEICLW